MNLKLYLECKSMTVTVEAWGSTVPSSSLAAPLGPSRGGLGLAQRPLDGLDEVCQLLTSLSEFLPCQGCSASQSAPGCHLNSLWGTDAMPEGR